MADGTGIEWTDATWNPITGCSVVSPGCKNCYAMKLAGGRLQNHWSRQGLTDATKVGPVWNGIVQFNHNWIDQPLRWRKPRMIFVCAHGDLFHEAVPEEWIDNVFAVMALAPWHTFQVLTKRAQRMRDYLSHDTTRGRIFGQIGEVCRSSKLGAEAFSAAADRLSNFWPFSNVWLGVSVENQTLANERVPLLLDTPAAVRWISAEPLLGPVDLVNVREYSGLPILNALRGTVTYGDYLARSPKESSFNTRTQITPPEMPGIDWLVVGGESGPGARPMHPDWARSLIEQCNTYDVPVLFKQWGAWLPVDSGHPKLRGPGFGEFDHCKVNDPGNATHIHVGKKAAGRVIDGRTWGQYPEPRA